MLTQENLLFTENFPCQIQDKLYFPAYTKVSDIAKKLGYPEPRVRTAIRKHKHRIAQWEISRV